MNKIKEEFKALSIEELVERIDALRRDLFSLRLHAATEPVKDKTQFKRLRKDIARGLTYLNQKTDQALYESFIKAFDELQ